MHQRSMAKKQTEHNDTKQSYWLVFTFGIIYALLLGLFTYLFNNPI